MTTLVQWFDPRSGKRWRGEHVTVRVSGDHPRQPGGRPGMQQLLRRGQQLPPPVVHGVPFAVLLGPADGPRLRGSVLRGSGLRRARVCSGLRPVRGAVLRGGGRRDVVSRIRAGGRRRARHLQLRKIRSCPSTPAAARSRLAAGVRPSGDVPLLPAKRRASGTTCARSRFERLVTGGAIAAPPPPIIAAPPTTEPPCSSR